MVGPRVVISRVFYGCEQLEAVLDDRSAGRWQGQFDAAGRPTVQAEYLPTTKTLLINRQGEVVRIPVTEATSIDIYLPPRAEGNGYLIAPSGTNVDQLVLQRCGFAPGGDLVKMVRGSPRELDVLHDLVRRHLPESTTSTILSWSKATWATNPVAVRDRVRSAVGETTWLRYLAGTLTQRSLALSAQGKTIGRLHLGRHQILGGYYPRIPPAHRIAFAQLYAQFAIYAGSASRLVIQGASEEICASFRAAMPQGLPVICETNAALANDAVFFAIVLGPDMEGEAATAVNTMARTEIAAIVELLEAIADRRQKFPNNRTTHAQRILYGPCKELLRQEDAFGLHGWALPAEDLQAWPGGRRNLLLVRRGDEGAVVVSPFDVPIDLYLDPALQFLPERHAFRHRPTPRQQELSELLRSTHQCPLPPSVEEEEVLRAARFFPRFSLGIKLLTGNGEPRIWPTPTGTTTDGHETIHAALDCDPKQLHVNCPGLNQVGGIVPDLVKDTKDRPNLFGAALTFDTDIVHWDNVQLLAGFEAGWTYYADANTIGLNGFVDLMARFAVRHRLLALDNFLFFPGIIVGGGLSVLTPMGFVGGTYFVNVPLLRYAGRNVFAEFGLQLQERRFDNEMNAWETTVTTSNRYFEGGMEGKYETLLATLEIGIPFGEPEFPEVKPPAPVEVVPGILLVAHPIEFVVDQPSEAMLEELLDRNDLATIFAMPIFRRPMHERSTILADAFAQIATTIRHAAANLHESGQPHTFQIICAVDTSQGNADEALALAERRAILVRTILVRLGVPAERLVVKAWSTAEAERELAAMRTHALTRLRGAEGNVFIRLLTPAKLPEIYPVPEEKSPPIAVPPAR